MQHPFEIFLKDFTLKAAKSFKQLNKMSWILETTGSHDAADLKGELEIEYQLLYHDKNTYAKLLRWNEARSLLDPILRRQLDVLLRAFKQNQISSNLLEEIAKKQADLSYFYGNFRPTIDGRSFSENDIRLILKTEKNLDIRKQAWEASKQIGVILAPKIIELVTLRNMAAKELGYSDYFSMQLELQEIDATWLFQTFDTLVELSKEAYSDVVSELEQELTNRYNVKKEDLGPWAWNEPFGQEDPLEALEIDAFINKIDVVDESVKFYDRMGIDVRPVLAKSDLFERNGKNQHAFCLNIDRGTDVRTLNNVKPTIKWLETMLHEFGHAIYELGIDQNLPWILREPAHMFTTESMALIAGRQAYLPDMLCRLIPDSPQRLVIVANSKASLRRRQLIFSRWVSVMTHFEKELYRDPSQNLNELWWHLVSHYQKISPPQNREGKADWAAKMHIGLAPVYYYSYLLGEMFASSIQKQLTKETGSEEISNPAAGHFLKEKLFYPANKMRWTDLVEHVTSRPLTSEDWIDQFR